MQTKNKKPAVVAAVMLAFCSTLFSFSMPTGGDSFTIYLNNKMVLQQYIYKDKEVKTLSLQQSNYNDELHISYRHCGTVGKDRTIIIKDGQDRMLKQWHFTDTNSDMSCKVKDILDLKKGNTSLKLYYSSKELPTGYLLASVVVADNGKAKP